MDRPALPIQAAVPTVETQVDRLIDGLEARRAGLLILQLGGAFGHGVLPSGSTCRIY